MYAREMEFLFTFSEFICKELIPPHYFLSNYRFTSYPDTICSSHYQSVLIFIKTNKFYFLIKTWTLIKFCMYWSQIKGKMWIL